MQVSPCHFLAQNPSLVHCCRQSNGSPKDAHALIPGNCEYVMLNGKGELGLQIELKLLIC